MAAYSCQGGRFQALAVEARAERPLLGERLQRGGRRPSSCGAGAWQQQLLECCVVHNKSLRVRSSSEYPLAVMELSGGGMAELEAEVDAEQQAELIAQCQYLLRLEDSGQ